MKLAHFAQDKLRISTANMRYGKKAPDVSDILATVRERGVIVPLIVRPYEGCAPDEAEIVAGARRWTANGLVLADGVDHGPLACAVMDPGDDAAALEASLIENVARRDPDEVTQWMTFTRLIQKEGRTPEQIGQTFDLTDLQVRRILALGNLLPRIRALYGQKAIDAPTIRHLTMASKAQQRDWLALYDDPQQHAPVGMNLKAWLFGGQSIPTKVAIFDLAAYPGRIVTDLFGEDGYFEDADLFWTCQNEAVAALRDRYLADGWQAVEVLDVGQYFYSYEYEKTPKTKGGKVFIAVNARGEVTAHEGYLSGKEARKARAAAAKGDAAEGDASGTAAPAKPEVTSTMQTYLDLHRHAAARAVLADHPGVALRLLIAHAIAGSPLWSVKIEPQAAHDPATVASVAASASEAAFAAKRRAALALLGFPAEDETLTRGGHDEARTAAIFARLVGLGDEDLLAIAAVVMGETLHAGGAMVEAVGAYLKVDMAALWSPDPLFFDLIRDRATANAILREIGGKKVADGNVTEKLKTQKAIVQDFLAGTNDRPKIEAWTPKWLAFPASRYTDRPFALVARWDTVKAVVRRLPQPASRAAPAPAEPYPVAAE